MSNVPENAKNCAARIVFTAIIVTSAVIIDRKIRKKAYKEMLAKHGKETAEKMRKEFNADLKRIRDANYDNEKKEQRKINELCRKYGVSQYYTGD